MITLLPPLLDPQPATAAASTPISTAAIPSRRT
jgi:hypothetical protein